MGILPTYLEYGRVHTRGRLTPPPPPPPPSRILVNPPFPGEIVADPRPLSALPFDAQWLELGRMYAASGWRVITVSWAGGSLRLWAKDSYGTYRLVGICHEDCPDGQAPAVHTRPAGFRIIGTTKLNRSKQLGKQRWTKPQQ